MWWYQPRTIQIYMARNPISSPVILLLEVADGDEAGATPHSKLVFLGGPLNTAGSTVDPEDDQSGLPHITFQSPHISVTISATGHDAVALRSPVDTCHTGRGFYYTTAVQTQL